METRLGPLRHGLLGVPGCAVRVVLLAFARPAQRLIAAGDEADDAPGRDLEGRRRFRCVEHAEAARGSGADVDEPAAGDEASLGGEDR